MKRIALLSLLMLILTGKIAANPLLSYGGRWILISHRIDQGEQKGLETRIGWEAKEAWKYAQQQSEGWKNNPMFGGLAIFTDSLSIITIHRGPDAEIFVFKDEIKLGSSIVSFILGTGWEAGDKFKVVTNLKTDVPYDSILFPDLTEKEIQFQRNLVPRGKYDILELDLICLDSGYEDRVEKFRFRRISK